MKKSARSAAIVFFMAITLSLFSQSNIQTIVLRPDPDEGIDADIRTDMAQTPQGSSKDFIANAWTAQGSYFNQRSLLKFDLSQIPAGATVVHATLFLFTNLNTGHYQLDSGANAACLLRVTEPWSENTVTWDNQPLVSMQDPVFLPQSTSNTQNYEVDVTGHIADMVSNPANNFGWSFRLQTEEKYRCMVFASSDNPVEDWRPQLVVQYKVCQAPEAGFTWYFANSTAYFTDTSHCINPLSWSWEFGDGTTSALQHPIHEYGQPGVYEVCLTITDSCGQDIICSVAAIIPPLKPQFTTTQNETDNLEVTFQCISAGASWWLWDFGDGTTSPEQNPVHVYKTFGEYIVCITAGNSGSRETACSPLVVKNISIQSNDNRILFYPNPVTGEGKLHFILFEDSGQVDITVTDLGGKPIIKQVYKNIRANVPVEMKIDLEGNGTWVVESIFNNYRKATKLDVFP